VPVLLDTTPLRVNPSYRRLFTGFTLSGIGAQLAVVAIGLQVYALSGTSFAVGLVGLFALVPLVVMGLYGGALVDAHDRRLVALVAGLVGWAVSIANAAYAWLGHPTLWWLYLVVALQSAAFGVVSPARSSIPCTPMITMSTCSDRMACTATGPTRPSEGVRRPPVRTTVRSGR